MAGANTLEFSDANFDQEVLKSDKPVLVDFWATWCAPCRMIAPAVEAIAAEYANRAQVGKLCKEIQKETARSVELAFVDQGYTGDKARAAAEKHKIKLEVIKALGAKRGFVLLPRRWVVERSFAWLARFRRLAKDYERLASTLRGLHVAAFAFVMLARLVNWGESS